MRGFQRNRFLVDRLHELTRLGLMTPPEYRELKPHVPAIEVEQVANDFECPIMDLPDGRALYVIWLSLTAERPGTRLDYYRVEPPWPDSNFGALPSFQESHVGEYYKLPGGLDYPRKDILNFNFVKSGWRLPGTRVEGLLCAISDTPIPDEFKHGASIPVSVRFFSRAGQQLAATTAYLWADRLNHRLQPARPLGVEVRAAEPKIPSNPAASSAAASPGRSIPRSRRPLSDLWAESEQVAERSPTATKARDHVPGSSAPEERDETRPSRT